MDSSPRQRNSFIFFPLPWKVWIVLVAWIIGCGVLVKSKSDNNFDPKIRGHTEAIEGVYHGWPSQYGARYCSYCHGTQLQGGQSGQPSCFRCHGKTWDDSFGENDAMPPTRAPANHTDSHFGYMHQPNLEDPEANCIACHGENLLGSQDLHTPSCLLCHEALWEE